MVISKFVVAASAAAKPTRSVSARTGGARLAALLGALALSACQQYEFVEIASGFEIISGVRPALAEDGTVVAAEPEQLLVGNGTSSSAVDLAALGLEMGPTTPRHPLRVRSEGDIVFLANRPAAPGCLTYARGAYRVSTAGGPLSTYFEGCLGVTDEGEVKSDIGLSLNGTVAFSQINNGDGAIYRGPVAGPVASLRSGSGVFYNTGGLDVNDAGRVVTQMEYVDGFAGGLMRAVLAFDTPEQALATVHTAIEKMSIGSQPAIAINNAGTVAIALKHDVSFPIGGTLYSFVAGVYRATPTLFNTPKSLTLVADLSGPYCSFGGVDINDAGDVVFEAALDTEFNCVPSVTQSFDGLFTGASATAAVVTRGDEKLGGHQFFDSVVLGEINNAGQVSFITTYSEPLVEPIKVWRADKAPLTAERRAEARRQEQELSKEQLRAVMKGR